MDAEEIARRLTEARGQRSQRAAADAWGVAQQTVCYWENGSMFPTRKMHVAIVAQILNVDPEVIRAAGRRRALQRQADRVNRQLADLEQHADPEERAKFEEAREERRRRQAWDETEG